jgi:hypothetical protein
MEQQLDPRWRKSTYSGNGGEACIETGIVPGRVLVRDTKQHANGPVVSVSPAAWRRFTVSILVNAPQSLAASALSTAPGESRTSRGLPHSRAELWVVTAAPGVNPLRAGRGARRYATFCSVFSQCVMGCQRCSGSAGP